MASKTSYKEVQRFRRWEVFGLLVALMAFTVYHLFATYGHPDFDQEKLLLKSMLILLILGGSLAYLLSIRLELKIDDEKIRYRYYPLHFRRKKIFWSEVAACEVVEFPLAAQLNGWGIHFGEQMISVNHYAGIRLVLKNGERLFISCKDPEALRDIVGRCGGR